MKREPTNTATHQEPMQAHIPGWGFLPAAEMANRQASGQYSCQTPLCAPGTASLEACVQQVIGEISNRGLCVTT